MYIYFILFYAIWKEKLSLCSQQRNLTSAQMLALCAKAVFHAPALVSASQRTGERLISALCSRSIFPFWLLARGEGNIMSFLTTPNYLHSSLPWEQRSLKNKTSAELLLLLKGSQVTALVKSHLAHFSLSSLELHLQLPTNKSDGKYTASDFIRMCKTECEGTRNLPELVLLLYVSSLGFV